MAPTEAPVEKDFTITPETAPETINIETITYKLNVTNVTAATDIIFELQNGDWGLNQSAVTNITEKKVYDITISGIPVSGLKNLGYLKSSKKASPKPQWGSEYEDVSVSAFEASIEKIVINGTYEVTLNTPVTTKASEEDKSKMKLDLPNVWYGGDAPLEIGKAADDRTLYITKNEGDILFGTPGKTLEAKDVKKVPINKIEYILDVDSITTPTEMTVEGAATIPKVNISEKKSYTFSGTLDAAKGINNLGYIHAPEACGGIKGSISTIKINDKEMKFVKSASFGELKEDKGEKYYELTMPNIWNTLNDLDIIALDNTGDSMLIYSKTDNLLVFVQSIETLNK